MFASKEQPPTYELAAFVTPAPQPGALRAAINRILGKRIEIVALPPSVQTIVSKIEGMMQERRRIANLLDGIEKQLEITKATLYNEWVSADNLDFGMGASETGIDVCARAHAIAVLV